eukprot:scaffold68165_cov105-Phaeocystis_antarctica.AAC.1
MLPHTRRPPIPYAIRVPTHRWSCTLPLTARLRLHGPCYRATWYTVLAPKEQKEVFLCPPPLGCYAGCYADCGLSIVAFSSSRPHLQYVPKAVHRPCTLRLWPSKRRAAAR